MEQTPFEETLSKALDDWVFKVHNLIAINQHPEVFMQILRLHGLEIVKLGDTNKLRADHRIISAEVLAAWQEMVKAKQRIDEMNNNSVLEKEKDE